MLFKMGDQVGWRSQAGGRWKEKIGKVIEVVNAATAPKYFPSNRCGFSRDHESYVVRTGPRVRDVYWPIVSKLNLV